MGLETATYIEDLVPANPVSSDNVSQGDDHLRLIKSVLQSQFTSLGSAAITATASEINDIGASGSIRTGLTTAQSDITALEGVQPVYGHVRKDGTPVAEGTPSWVALGAAGATRTSTGDYTISMPSAASNGWIVQITRSNENDTANLGVPSVTAQTTTSFSIRWDQVTGGASEGNDVDTEFHFVAYPY